MAKIIIDIDAQSVSSEFDATWDDPHRVGANRLWTHGSNGSLMKKSGSDPTNDDDGATFDPLDESAAAITGGTIDGVEITTGTIVGADIVSPSISRSYVNYTSNVLNDPNGAGDRGD